MYYARVENGVVVNIIVADDVFALEQNLVPLQGSAGIGWFYDNGLFTPSPQTETTN